MNLPPLEDYPRLHFNEAWDRINYSPKSSLRCLKRKVRPSNIYLPPHVPMPVMASPWPEGFDLDYFLSISPHESWSPIPNKRRKTQPSKSHSVEAPVKTIRSTKLAVHEPRQLSSLTSGSVLDGESPTATTRPALSTITNSIGKSNTPITSPTQSDHHALKDYQYSRGVNRSTPLSPTTPASPRVIRAMPKRRARRNAITPSRSWNAGDESHDSLGAEFAENPSVDNVDSPVHILEPPSTPTPTRPNDQKRALIVPTSSAVSRPRIPHWTEEKLTDPALDRFLALILAAAKTEQPLPPNKPVVSRASLASELHDRGEGREKRGTSPTVADKLLLSDGVPSIDDPSYTQWITTIEAARPEIGFSDGQPDCLQDAAQIEPVVTIIQEPSPSSLLAEPSPSSAYPSPADAATVDSDLAELLLSLGQLTISVSPPTPPLSGKNQDVFRPVGYTSPLSTSVITISPLTSPVPEQISNVQRASHPTPILPSRSELSLMMANNPWNCLPIPSPLASPLAAVPRSSRAPPITPTAVRLFHPYARVPVGKNVRRRVDDPFEMTIPPAVQLAHGFLSPKDAGRNSRSRWSPRPDPEKCTPMRVESARLGVGQMDIQPITPPVVRHSRIVTQAWGTRSPSSGSTIHPPASQPDTSNASMESLYPSASSMSAWKAVVTPIPPVALNDRRVCERMGDLKELEQPSPIPVSRPSPRPRIPGAYDFDDTIVRRPQAIVPFTPTPHANPRFTTQNRRPALSIEKPGKANRQPVEEPDQQPSPPPAPSGFGRWLKGLFGFAQ